MYIAVVCKGPKGSIANTLSSRPNGDWASFLSHSKAVAIDRAMEANEKWGGKYSILVGELHEIVKPRRDYYLKSL